MFGWAVWTAGKAAESLERVLRETASPLPLIAGVLIALTPLVLATQIDWQTLIEDRRIRLLPRSRPPR